MMPTDDSQGPDRGDAPAKPAVARRVASAQDIADPPDLGRSLLGFRVHWLQMFIFLVIAILSLVLVFDTAARVSRQLEALRTSRADNQNYTVTQLEVESLDFALAVNVARQWQIAGQAGPAVQNGEAAEKERRALRQVRMRFDIFYSRIKTLENGLAHRVILESGGEPGLQLLLAFLDRTVPVMDGPDAALLALLPRLEGELLALRSVTRQLASQTITANAAAQERTRLEISRLLGRLALLSTVLVASLLAFMFFLWRLYRINRIRAVENRATLARLSTIVETSPDAIIVTSADGVITDFNAAAEAMFLLNATEAKGKSIGRLVKNGDFHNPAPAPERTGFVPAIDSGDLSNLHLVGQRADGALFPVELSTGMANLRDRPHCVIFLRDISERVAARRALEESRDQALAGERAKSRFMAVMSHEMRTPLNGILGVLDLMRDKKVDAGTRELLEVMEGAGQALLGHVNDVLDIARLEVEGVTLRKSDFDLDKLLRELMGGLEPGARARGNVMEMTCNPDPLGRWRGDPARLRQVLTNLLGNAVKFTRDGHVGLDVNLNPQPDGGAMLEVQVIDTGRGIPTDVLEKIFDDFVRVEAENTPQEEGTGLGLGIARRLVAAMDGNIGAESEEGEGSLFWVSIPLDAPQSAAHAPATPQMETAPRRKVLMVEDNATNRFILREMLRREGQDVSEAVNGVEGVKAAESEAFDLILIDISMPLMDGLEATRRIRAGGGPSAGARIVALTAHVIGDERDRYDAAGMDGVATKPLNLNGLRRILSGQGTEKDTAPAQKPVLDAAVLGELDDAMPRIQLIGLLQGFLDEGNDFIAVLPDLSVLPEDAQASAARVHYFSGLAATMGARRLHKALSAVETHLKTKDSAAARAAIAKVAPLWQLTVAEVEDQMAG